MSRPRRCTQTWYGECSLYRLPGLPRPLGHSCARPAGHPVPCMCYCGDRPAPDGQEPLWDGAA